MKLLVDGHHLGTSGHGVNSFLWSLLTSDMMKDYDVVLYVSKGADVDRLEVLENFEIVRGPTLFLLRLFIFLPYLTFLKKPDLVWGQNFLPVFCRKATKRLVTVHDFLPLTHKDYFSRAFRTVFGFLVAQASKGADRIILSTDYSMQVLKGLFPACEKKGCVIPIPIEFDEVASDAETSQVEPYCIYVSRFEKRKNHMRLISAWNACANDGHKLVLVGFDVDGSKLEVERFVQQLGLKNIEFRQGLPRQELVDLLAGADFAIYPSLAEGFGMPICEAYAINGNIAFSHESAMRDFVDINACPFNPYETDEIAKAIDNMFAAPNVKGTLEWSKKLSTLRDRFGVPSVSRKYQEVFRETQ